MRLICWNVNGIRSVYGKGLGAFLDEQQPDLFCIQETKAQQSQLLPEILSISNYSCDFSDAVKKGYSGVATFYKPELNIRTHSKGIGVEDFDQEGRFIISELSGGYKLYNIYFPSGTTGELRQNFKYNFLDAITEHFSGLTEAERKKIIICGDFNICHQAIDIHHPDKATKLQLSGFLPAEREWFTKFLDLGFIDTFRELNGQVPNRYSWWSFRAGARKKNLGWRIDYILVSADLQKQLRHADILDPITGSDHAPILLDFEV